MILIFHLCKSDSDWSSRVKASNDDRCILCNRKATPAHVFKRGYLGTRRILENGVPLCIKHHEFFDSLNPVDRKAYAILLIGEVIYDILNKIKDGDYDYVTIEEL